MTLSPNSIKDSLKEAYLKLSGQEPDAEMKGFELADYVVKNWDVPRLGEDLAKRCIFQIVNHTDYPNDAVRVDVVGNAELKIEELFDIPEGHMAVLEELERQYSLRHNEGIESEPRHGIKLK